MPLYEYKCLNCKNKFTIFCKISEIKEYPKCEFCESNNTIRLVSRFKTVRSEEQILESLADPTILSNIDENDPISVAKWAKKIAKEMGEDMGDEIEALAEEELTKSKSQDTLENTSKDNNSFNSNESSNSDEESPLPPTSASLET